MAKPMNQRPPGPDSFPQFSKLADEIRLMIWEITWPAPRLIEAALFENPDIQWEEWDEDSDEPSEIINLRLAGRLSTLLKKDLGSRIVEQGPVERCPAPVALQICHQSRMHTLRRYRVMTSLAGPFYYHPQRDVMFFSIDVADDYPEYMPVLNHYHSTELNSLETVLVLNCEWPGSLVENGPMDYTLDCISHLGGLKIVQILWEESESDSEGSVEPNEEGEEEGPQALANRLRKSFPAIIEHGQCAAKTIEVIDLDGNLY